MLFISSWQASSMPKKSTNPFKIWSNFQLWHFMTQLWHNYDTIMTLFKVAQSYPHGPKLAQLTVLTTWGHSRTRLLLRNGAAFCYIFRQCHHTKHAMASDHTKAQQLLQSRRRLSDGKNVSARKTTAGQLYQAGSNPLPALISPPSQSPPPPHTHTFLKRSATLRTETVDKKTSSRIPLHPNPDTAGTFREWRHRW